MASHYGFTSPPLPEGAEPVQRHDALVATFEKEPTPLDRYRITVGNYIIYLDRMLGSGGTAEVFMGKDKISGAFRAVKRIDKRELDEPMLDMIAKEYDIVSHLDHPNIIKFYDYKEFERYIYIFMDYYPEGDLVSYEEPFEYLNECTAWLAFRQVLDALVYLHEHHIIHRDIKLDNILLKDTSDMSVALADFGFAEILPENDAYITKPLGTPNYMAPEFFKRKPYDGYKADIWALGVTLYVMVCGYQPFEADDMYTLAKKIIYDTLKFPEHVTSECRQVIRDMLTRDPEQRISLYQIYDSEWYLYWSYFVVHAKCSPNPKKF